MAAQLEQMRLDPAPPRSAPRADGASPRLLGAPLLDNVAPSAGGVESSTTPADSGGGPKLLRLDALQRVGVGALAVLGALGYGRSSPALLDADTIGTLQGAFLGLLALHVAAAAYGTFALAPRTKQPPPAWFVKVGLTGVGGLAELVREADEETQRA